VSWPRGNPADHFGGKISCNLEKYQVLFSCVFSFCSPGDSNHPGIAPANSLSGETFNEYKTLLGGKMTGKINDLKGLEFPGLDFNIEDFPEVDLSDLEISMEGFNLPDLGSSTPVETDFVMVNRYPRHHPRLVKYERAVDLAAKIPDLIEGDACYAIVSGNFIFGDFIEAVMVEKNWIATEMIVATLSLGKENVDSLHNLQKGGYVEKMGLIVSDYWYSHERRPLGGVPYIVATLGREEFTFAAAGLHTKVTLIKTDCGKHIVMHGSANLRSSRNIEQVMIENNQTLYEFNRAWTTALLERFQATHKSLRGNTLWQTIVTEQMLLEN